MSPPHSQIACTRPTLRDAGSQVRPRQLFGLTAGPDWDDQASRRPRADQRSTGLSQSFSPRPQLILGTSTKIQGVHAARDRLRGEVRVPLRGIDCAATGGGGRSAPDPYRPDTLMLAMAVRNV